jgi:hypothetical protein
MILRQSKPLPMMTMQVAPILLCQSVNIISNCYSKLANPSEAAESNAKGGRPRRVSPIHRGRAYKDRSKKRVFSDDHDDDDNLPHYPDKRPRTRTTALRFGGEPDGSKIEFRVTASKKGQKGSKGVHRAWAGTPSPVWNTLIPDIL